MLGYKVRRQRRPRVFHMVADVLPTMYISHEALKGEIIDLAFHLLATVVRGDPRTDGKRLGSQANVCNPVRRIVVPVCPVVFVGGR